MIEITGPIALLKLLIIDLMNKGIDYYNEDKKGLCFYKVTDIEGIFRTDWTEPEFDSHLIPSIDFNLNYVSDTDLEEIPIGSMSKCEGTFSSIDDMKDSPYILTFDLTTKEGKDGILKVVNNYLGV